MHELSVTLTVAAGLVLALGLLSRPLERLPVTAPMVALATGALLGPHALGVLDVARWGEPLPILDLAARLTMAIGLMGIALRLPPGFLEMHGRSMAVLLVLVLPLMALAGAALAYWVLGLPLLLALLAGAIACPTDPIVATTIASGSVAEKSLPERLRFLILGESGANDGLAYPLVLLPMLLMDYAPEEAWTRWALEIVIWKVGGAIVAGAALGWAAGWLLVRAERHHAIEITSFFAYSIALTLLSFGAAELLRLDSILAVFAGGIAFGRAIGAKERAEDERVQEAINRLFTLPIFALIGIAIPWEGWRELGAAGLLAAALVLVLRRLPFVLLLRRGIPGFAERRDALFAGWFGPIGIAALSYAAHATERTGEHVLWSFATLLICASVVAHGVTAAPFTRLYSASGVSASGMPRGVAQRPRAAGRNATARRRGTRHDGGKGLH